MSASALRITCLGTIFSAGPDVSIIKIKFEIV